MPKKREYYNIKCTCDTSEYVVSSICEADKVEEMKRRVLKSAMDFVNINATEHHVNIVVEKTEVKPESGTEVSIKPINAHEVRPAREIDVIKLD